MVSTIRKMTEKLKYLHHPNIVDYLGYEDSTTFFAIFLEYIPSRSLTSLVEEHAPFQENAIKFIASHVLDGLAYLHSHDIAHDNLTPKKIILTESGTCKIVVPSLHHISNWSSKEPREARTRGMEGLFLLPPQTSSHSGDDATAGVLKAADVWSFGNILLAMWCGLRPWSVSEMTTIMFKVYIEKKTPPAPSGLQLSDVAEDFRRLCFVSNYMDRPTALVLGNHGYLSLPSDYIFGGFGSLKDKSRSTTSAQVRKPLLE
ncbi:kinase-like domain-containing protein [Flagelloscypha sp. PMI_526]|nr:kinase-like domain-containing protein [Flagelloscypha sp. PMI_526]